LPAAVAYGIHDRLTSMAKAHGELASAGPEGAAGKAEPDGTKMQPRTMDQLRADLFADMLLRGTPAGHDTPDGLLAAITARVDVTVPVLTLIEDESSAQQATSVADKHAAPGDNRQAGARGRAVAGRLDRAPAELNGRHPIDPETARILAGQATAWNRVLTDPISAAVLAVERYRPGGDLKRLLTARDSRCRFPGCGVPARELDLDHTHDAALGGATAAANLAGLCRRHHVLKHNSNWTTRQSGGGNLEWTSPTGRNYADGPPTPAANTVPDGKTSAVKTFSAKTAATGSRGEPIPPPF
jgi:hypothetical protein